MKTNQIEQCFKRQLQLMHKAKALFLSYQRRALDGEDTRKELLDYILAAERLAVHARSLPNFGCAEQGDDLIRAILPAAHDINVALLPEGWVYLTLDSLLPAKGKKIPKEFILYPLTFALERFQKDTLYQLAYSRTTVVIRHVYAEGTPLGLVRDHDNIETKTLLDTLKAHLLPDDNGLTCSIFVTARFGARDMTEVFVLPYSDTPAWYEIYG